MIFFSSSCDIMLDIYWLKIREEDMRRPGLNINYNKSDATLKHNKLSSADRRRPREINAFADGISKWLIPDDYSIPRPLLLPS
jgi:hypothetical protein